MKLIFFLLCIVTVTGRNAQSPPGNNNTQQGIIKFSTSPVIDYTLSVDKRDLTSYAVTMHIRNAPAIFKLAMVKHFEYDDKFWKFVKDLKIRGDQATGSIVRL